VGFAKDDDVIQAFSADRANQPLRMHAHSVRVIAGQSGDSGCPSPPNAWLRHGRRKRHGRV
jgi:hypothetical protein